MNAITKALNAGKEITIHESSVSVPGYTGSGYVVFDPITGDKADMVSGGSNGGGVLTLNDAQYMLLRILSISFDVHSFLAVIAELEKFVKIFAAISLFMNIAMLLSDLSVLHEKCNTDVFYGNIIMPYYIVISGMILIATYAAFMGPMVILAMGIVFQEIGSSIHSEMLQSASECKE